MMVDKNIYRNWSFQGKWIRGVDENYDNQNYYADHPHTILRKEFDVVDNKEVTLCIACLGYYIVYINNKRVLDYELNSDWTVYSKRVYYDVLDISSYVQTGKNEIKVELGNGMYNPSPLRLFGKYNLREKLSEVGQPMFICDLIKNQEIILKSDQTWDVYHGNILFNNLYLGEKVNLNLEEFYVSNATSIDMDKYMVLSEIPKIRRKQEVVYKKKIGNQIYDFEEMISGMINIKFHAEKGQIVTIRYSECIDGDTLNFTSSLAGSVGQKINDFVIKSGKGCPKKAIQTDTIICKDGLNVFTNKFTYHSFRYLDIQGIDHQDIEYLSANYVHTDLNQIGIIHTDNEFYNELYDSAMRTKLNNVHSVFEDCARERLGYGGDIVALATSNLYTFDLEKLYKKVIIDFRLEQTPAGGIVETAPYIGIQTNGTADKEGPILWQLVYPYLLYKHYQYYGDIELLKEEYPYVKKHLDYLLDYPLEKLVNCCIGDHGSILISGQFKKDTPDKLFLGYCTILLLLRYNISVFKTLNKDICHYQKEYDRIKQLTISRFLNNDGTFGEKTQSGYAFAVELELINPKELCQKFVNKIIDDNYTFNTGIFGMMLSYEVLNRYNYNEVIEQWLNKEDIPSYKAMLAGGNKALAELFIGKHLSYNHAMFASYQQWYYQGLAGIQIKEDAVGFNKVLLCPYFSKKVNQFECQIQTKQGLLASSWIRVNNEIIWTIEYPTLMDIEIGLNNQYQKIEQKLVGKNKYLVRLSETK
ncbi:MAG: family 78 glycoside hydrolase catalytic domain [Coprobacillus sp.]